MDIWKGQTQLVLQLLEWMCQCRFMWQIDHICWPMTKKDRPLTVWRQAAERTGKAGVDWRMTSLIGNIVERYGILRLCLPACLYVRTLLPLTLWRPLLPYGTGTAIKHPVPDQVKPSFVNFDIGALWHWALSVSAPTSKCTHDGLPWSDTKCFIAVCTYVATVGVKELTVCWLHISL